MKGNYVIKTIKETVIPLAGVVVVLLNLWLAGKLSPLTQDITVNKIGVLANEKAITSLESSLCERLNRIENKLANLLRQLL